MKNLNLIFACLAAFAFASCVKEQSAPTTIHYRFIQQMTAYHEDGDVSYHDFVAHSGTAAYSDGKASFDLAPSIGEGGIELALRFEGDVLLVSIGDIETRGDQNVWVRIRKPNSDTFGSDTECEIWVGSETPPNE